MPRSSDTRSTVHAADRRDRRRRRLCVGIAVTMFAAFQPTAALARPDATQDTDTEAWSYYAVDPHVHSVVSGDATDDLGILSEGGKAAGLDALFITDHAAASYSPIGGIISSNVFLDEDVVQWRYDITGSPTAETNALSSAQARQGSNSLELAITGPGTETMRWLKRGPNLRAGDVILDFSVFPTQIDPGSGIYVSVSLGGDATVPDRIPDGYTTNGGVIATGRTTVFVYQVGTPRSPSADPEQRVVTTDLAYTLGQWNDYSINLTDAIDAALPFADQPLDYNAFLSVKIAAATNGGGTASGFVDDYSLSSSAVPSPATSAAAADFVARNAVISDYDTADFRMLPALEMGNNDHSQRLVFDIDDPSEFVHVKKGTEGIPLSQAEGYPAMLNHPGLPGGVTEAEAVTNLGYGADLMETVDRGSQDIMIRIWDQILQDGRQIIGTWTSDSHRVEKFGPSTFVHAPELSTDELLHSLFEGRAYMADVSFPGRIGFNLDVNSSDPYPARYPVFISADRTTVPLHLQVTDGLTSGDQVVWIRDGVVVATDTVSGTSFNGTKGIAVHGDSSYVRVEIRKPGGTRVAMTQPIWMQDVMDAPLGVSLHADRVVTPDNRFYTRSVVQGVVSSSYDDTTGVFTMETANPAGSLVELGGTTGGLDVDAVEVDGAPIPAATSLDEFDDATDGRWFFHEPSHTLHVKAVQGSGTGAVDITLVPGSDTEPPTAPGNVTAIAHDARNVTIEWEEATDDVGVALYTLYRDGGAIGSVGPTVTSYADTEPTPGATHTYSITARDPSFNIGPSASATVDIPEIVTTMVAPLADTYVSSADQSKNYGNRSTLRIDGSPELNGYLRFEVPPVSGRVLRADLEIWNNSSAGAGHHVHETDGGWTEDGIVWTNAPPFGAFVGESGPLTGGSYSAVDLRSILPLTGIHNFAMLTPNVTAISYQSREASTNHPRIVFETSSTAPEALPASISAVEDEAAVWIPPVSDEDGDPLTCQLATSPSHGAVTIAPDCSTATYTPNPDHNGTDSFTWSATDGTSVVPADAAVTIAPVNDAPRVDEETIGASVEQGGSTELELLAYDVEGDCPLDFTIVTPPTQGTIEGGLTMSCADGSAVASTTYTPTPGYHGPDSLTYEVSDPLLATSELITFPISVLPGSGAPTADPVVIETDEDIQAPWTPVVSDPDGDILSCAIDTPPTQGTASVAADCSSGTYDPAPDTNGTDSFTYRATDGLATATATVTVTIDPVNDAPSTADVDANTTAPDPVTIALEAIDVDGTCPISMAIASPPGDGTLGPLAAPTCADGIATTSVDYTPDGGFLGTDQFTYDASDGTASSTPGTVTIVVDDGSLPPTAEPVSFTTPEDTAATWYPVVDDPNGDELTCAIDTAPTAGTATVEPDCSSGGYEPDPDAHGSDGFTYSVSDGTAAATATVSVTVDPVNDAPMAADGSVNTPFDTPVTVTLSATDVDGTCPLTFVIDGPVTGGTVSSPTSVTCDLGVASAEVVFTPEWGFTSTTTIPFHADDGEASGAADITVLVASPIFLDGFESGALGAWSLVDGPSVVTSPALQGSHACRFLATNGDIHMETSFAPHDSVSVRFGLHIVEPPPASVAAIVRLRDPSGSAIFTLSMGSLGRLKARNEVTRTTSKSGPALDLDVWHDVEIVLDVSAGSYTVLVDGVAIDRLTDSGTNLGAQPIGHLQLGENAAGQPFDYVVDNVSVDVP